MKKYLMLSLLCCASTVYACNGYVFGFKGKDNIFDQRAFDSYVKHLGYCGQSYSWSHTQEVEKQIAVLTQPYHLYGFSQGAVSVKRVLDNSNLRKPEFVLTIGAYKTTDVNFDRYQVKYKNYFDHSGKGQTSPGVFLNVSHSRIQQEVNKIILGL